eukprot:EG_transcript_33938
MPHHLMSSSVCWLVEELSRPPPPGNAYTHRGPLALLPAFPVRREATSPLAGAVWPALAPATPGQVASGPLTRCPRLTAPTLGGGRHLLQRIPLPPLYMLYSALMPFQPPGRCPVASQLALARSL